MNVFAEMVYSVTSPKRYKMFLKDKKLKTFGFGFLLVLIYFLITIIVPFGRFEVSTGGIIKTIDALLPDFTIEDGMVDVSRTVDYSDGDTYIYVDTDGFVADEDEIRRVLRRYDRVVIMDSTQAVIKNSGQTRIIAYEDMDPELYMTKESLMDSLRPVVSLVVAAGLIIIFVGMELLFFFGVLFVALLGMIVASCMQYHLTFGQLYKLGIYTRTTPLLIKAVMSFLPFGIPLYVVISMGISLLYLSGAIRHMKTPGLQNGPLSFSSDTVGPQNGSGPQGNSWNGGSDLNDPWNGRKDEFDDWNRPYNG